MANIMTKRGSLDNVITYEHLCDTTADLESIPSEYITLGSIAIVLKGEAGIEVYMADSNREWISVFAGGGGSGGGGGGSNVDIATTEEVFEYLGI